MFKKISAIFIFLCVVFHSPMLAQLMPPDYAANSPWIISFQGRIDGVSSPVGTIAFKLYTYAENTEQMVWEEAHNNVELNNGIFNILLGSITPLPYSVFGSPAVMEVIVNGTPLTPRQPLAAAPVAFLARNQKYGTVDARNAWGRAVQGISEGGGNGIYGKSSGGTLMQAGVFGENDGDGDGVGVLGYGSGDGGIGVRGQSITGDGVYGLSGAINRYGVVGFNEDGVGVYGLSGGNNRAGVLGRNNNANGYGVYGSSTDGFGVYGYSSSSGAGKSAIYGQAFGGADGVVGFVGGGGGTGVYGFSTTGYGVKGVSNEQNKAGVYGGGGSGGYGVHGDNYDNYGVYGTSTNGFGVYGRSSGEAKAGVMGSNQAANGIGVRADASSGTAVFARSADGKSIVATNESQTNPTVKIHNAYQDNQNFPQNFGTALDIEKGKIKASVKDETAFLPQPAGAVTGVIDINIGTTSIIGHSPRIYNRYISEDSQIFYTVTPIDQFDYPPMMFLDDVGTDSQGGYFILGWGPTEVPAYNTGTFRIRYLVIN